MRARRRLVLALLTTLFAGMAPAARGLDRTRALNHYGHQVWHTDSGLPQNTVRSILQTRDGYLWLGTDGGLVRFDGSDWLTFDAEHTPAFKSDTVYDLLEDGGGALWISTAAGLVCYREGGFTAYTTAQGLPADTVWFTYQDTHHRLWAMTAGGPARWNGTAFTAVPGAQGATPTTRRGIAEDSGGRLWLSGGSGVFWIDTATGNSAHNVSGNPAEALAADKHGSVWIGSREGLSHFRNGTLEPLRLPAGPGKSEVTALERDGSDGMWVGTASGLEHLAGDGTALPAPANPKSADSPRVDSLFRDHEGTLWVAEERGVLRLNADRLEPFALGSELAVARILAMFEDREGDLWLGSDAGGVNVLRDQKFLTYTTADGLSGNAVRCVLQTPDGTVWIGTDGAGLNRRVGEGFQNLTVKDGLSSNVILSLAASPNGDVWVGTPDGLNRVHGGASGKIDVQRFAQSDGLPDDFIRSLFADGDGSLWIGTRHGLSHWAQGKFTSYSTFDGLGSDFIGVIVRGPAQDGGDGPLWIGTAGGLSRFEHGRFSNFTLPGTGRQASNTVTAIAPGAGGTLWLGTLNQGLAYFHAGRIEAAPRPALPATLYGILEDSAKRLWLSSPTGIYRVARPGDASAESITGYGTADGMNIRECSSDGHPAAARLADGSLWFATLAGVSVIDPAHTAENRVPPPVVLERVLVDDRPRSVQPDGKEITIDPGAHRLEFLYAGLSFAAPQKVEYRYRLQNFDKNWIDAGGRRAAFYTNLSPGHYRFEVLAANNDGVWSPTGAIVAFHLLPHFYQTWWFYTGLALLSLALAWLAYRWRVHQVEAQFAAVLAERGRLAREIHDTLAQGYVAISVQLELVGRLLATSTGAASKPVFEHLEQAREMVRVGLGEARRSIWELRQEVAATPDLPERLRASSKRITQGSAIKVSLEVAGTCRPLERRIEDELLRISEEAVTNTVRHANAARVDMQLTYQANRVSLRIADDGCGFAAQDGRSGPPGHFGLRGMHERAAEIRGGLAVESQPGAGTRVTVEVPLPNSTAERKRDT